MSQQLTNLPASVLDRLRNEARLHDQTFQETLAYYAFERFLYRLSQSEYYRQFILKGALAMVVWPVQIYRTTRDIDFRVYLESDALNVKNIIAEICEVEVEPDGLHFDIDSIRTENITERADYPGVRVRLVGYIGKVRIPIQIDLGFSDTIVPAPRKEEYPHILDFPPPTVYVYPPETVIAEKLESIFYFGELNSRMKDFYDIWSISNEFVQDGKLLAEAVRSTFRNRNASIDRKLSDLLIEEFAVSKTDEWKAFLKRIGVEEELMPSFSEVLVRITEFIQPVLDEVNEPIDIVQQWNPKSGWQ